MMIFHALVGYLAVTALPFHPFAFASPLAAIDYDGYFKLNTTTQNYIAGALVKQLPGSIAETSQTVTTQNHKDSALMKRVPGDIIEARQVPVAVPVILVIINIVSDVALSLLWIQGDDPVRDNDVEHLEEFFD